MKLGPQVCNKQHNKIQGEVCVFSYKNAFEFTTVAIILSRLAANANSTPNWAVEEFESGGQFIIL